MKVNKLPVDDKKFKPYSIKIDIESEWEAQRLYHIFNHSDIHYFMAEEKFGFCEKLKEVIGHEFYDRSARNSLVNCLK